LLRSTKTTLEAKETDPMPRATRGGAKDKDKNKKSSATCPYLAAVRTHADNLIQHGRDVYGPKHTPLFVNELALPDAVAKPAPWRFNRRTQNDVILCNLARHHPLLRVLDGLTVVTGSTAYRDAAAETLRFAFANLTDSVGLLYWGGHCSYDALSKDWVGYVPATHELKSVYPHYLLMHQVDAQATERFLQAFWNAHVLDWTVLDFNRHGGYDKPIGDLWDHPYIGRGVWLTTRGLTFTNTGSDLYYAAAMLHHFTGQTKPLDWAKRLHHRYRETCDPVTGMAGYQYSIRYLPSSDHWTDRAIHQFSGTLCGHVVREGTISRPRHIRIICFYAAMTRMAMYEMLGKEGEEFVRSAIDDLITYGRWAYRPDENIFHTIHTDGTILTGIVFEKDGYYGPAGDAFRSFPADGQFFLVYAKGYRLSSDAFLWQMVRDIGRGIGLGDLGQPGQEPTGVDLKTACVDPYAILGLIELHRATSQKKYLDLACRVADNVLAQRFKDGYFVSGWRGPAARPDDETPLALLHLSAELAGKGQQMPALVPGPLP
jgi:pectate lyase